MDKDKPKSFFPILSEDPADYQNKSDNEECLYTDFEEYYFMGPDWCGLEDDTVLKCTLLDTQDVYYIFCVDD